MNMNHRGSGVSSHGLTLVELLVVLAISAVLLTVAMPAFFGLVHASRLRGAADVLLADLRLTMTESTKHGGDVLISFQHNTDGSNWCYGLSRDTNCDCRVASACQIDGVEKITQGLNYSGILINPTHASYRFKPRRSTITAGNITFTAQDGKQLRVLISGYGRIRNCSPNGTTNLSGLPICP